MKIHVLLVEQGVQQHGIQIFGYGGVVPCGYGGYLLYGHNAVNDVEGMERFLGSAHPVSLLRGPGRTVKSVCIAHVGVLQLFGIGGFVYIQHKIAVGYFSAQEPQIYGGNCLQHAHASGTVAEAVVTFQGNPFPIIINAQQITAA